MSNSLTLKYRPRTFSDIVGQKPVRAVIKQMVLQDQLPPAILFLGPRGTGKTTTARILAAALNCQQRESADPCTVCPSCKGVEVGNSPDFLEIDAASNGLVGDIRSLREAVLYSVSGAYRVVVLDEAHSMSREAFNALLKTLEEPPPKTIFMLLTTEPGKILETVLSRCMTFDFRRVTVTDIADRLLYIAQQEQLSIELPLATEIAERSNGGMRDAVMLLDQCSRVNVHTIGELHKLMGDVDYAPRLFNYMCGGDLEHVFSTADEAMSRIGDPAALVSSLVHLVRELFILQAGGSIPRQGAPAEERQKLAMYTQGPTLMAAARVMWEHKTRIRVSDDPRSSMELALLMMTEALSGSFAAAAPVQAKQQPLTFQQLQDRALGKTSG